MGAMYAEEKKLLKGLAADGNEAAKLRLERTRQLNRDNKRLRRSVLNDRIAAGDPEAIAKRDSRRAAAKSRAIQAAARLQNESNSTNSIHDGDSSDEGSNIIVSHPARGRDREDHWHGYDQDDEEEFAGVKIDDVKMDAVIACHHAVVEDEHEREPISSSRDLDTENRFPSQSADTTNPDVSCDLSRDNLSRFYLRRTNTPIHRQQLHTLLVPIES